jgi:hypothetical protein
MVPDLVRKRRGGKVRGTAADRCPRATAAARKPRATGAVTVLQRFLPNGPLTGAPGSGTVDRCQ